MDKAQEINLNQKKIEYDNLKYSINVDEKTAEIIGFYRETPEVFVPRSITYESQEYIVISICEDAFENSDEMETIRFAQNSELRTIKQDAFACSSFHSIEIPSSVDNLEEGWCNEIYNVTDVIVSPKNQNYCLINGEFIVGKSSKEKENFDVLIFSVRNIEYPKIPDFIEIIGQFSFAECQKIKHVEISSNSNLQIIEKSAFACSSIESITIPPHLTKICRNAFRYCGNLQVIRIPSNSELQIIEKNAFFQTSIESIEIPSKVIELEESWCNETNCLNSVFVSPSNQKYASIDDKIIVGKSSHDKKEFDVLFFSVRNIKEMQIMDSIEIIETHAFANCEEITNVEISANSKLRIIGKESFANSSISKIRIPSQLTQICEGAFYNCAQLEQIEIPENSQLQIIDAYAFHDTLIESIEIPSTVIELKEAWCSRTTKLNKVHVMPDNKFYSSINDDKIIIGKSSLENTLVFVARDIQSIKIPDSIKIIGEFAFADCNKICHIEFSNNLAEVRKYAFYNALIDNLSFPSSLTHIYESAFANCIRLRKVYFPVNSNLKLIDEYAFAYTTIESIFIPSSVIEIAETAFYLCANLNIIEFGEHYELNVKYLDDIIIMMPTKVK